MIPLRNRTHIVRRVMIPFIQEGHLHFWFPWLAEQPVSQGMPTPSGMIYEITWNNNSAYPRPWFYTFITTTCEVHHEALSGSCFSRVSSKRILCYFYDACDNVNLAVSVRPSSQHSPQIRYQELSGLVTVPKQPFHYRLSSSNCWHLFLLTQNVVSDFLCTQRKPFRYDKA